MEPTEPAKEATEEAVEEIVQAENDAFVLATEDPLEKAQKIAEEKAKSKVIKQPKKIVNVSKIKVFLHEVGGWNYYQGALPFKFKSLQTK